MSLGRPPIALSNVPRYLHWSLPRLYRSGIAGSESAADVVNDRKQAGGFPTNNLGYDASAPTFRPIPTRWVIWRSVRGVTKPSGSIFSNFAPKAQPVKVAYPASDSYVGVDSVIPGDFSTVHDCFVVESVSKNGCALSRLRTVLQAWCRVGLIPTRWRKLDRLCKYVFVQSST